MEEKTKKVIRDMYPDAPKIDVDRLIHLAETSGLDPVQRHLYLICRKGKWQIQTGIDGFRAVAAANGLAGIDDVIFTHDAKGKLEKATVTVYKWGPDGSTRAGYTATAYWSEYNAGGNMWQTKPHVMLGKCVEALALRKATSQLAGLYTDDEMEQAGPMDGLVERAARVAPPATKTEDGPRLPPRRRARKATEPAAPVTASVPEVESHPLEGLGDDVRPTKSKDPEPPTDGDVMGPTALRELVKQAQKHAGLPFPDLLVRALGPDDIFDVTKLSHRAKMQATCEELLSAATTADVDAALMAAMKEHPELKSKLLAVVDTALSPQQQLSQITEIIKG